jgi:hypothetical protein
LYCPGCVRAKSGVAPLSHQHLLQILLRKGEIQLSGEGAEEMQKKLESNEQLRRGDTIPYISKFPGKLMSDCYAYLPPQVKKMLLPIFEEQDTRLLIRKGIFDGLFIHCVCDASDKNYRVGWTNTKVAIVKQTMKKLKRMLTFQIFRWLHFGNIVHRMSYKTFLEQFDTYEGLEHIYLRDLLSMYFDINIFVIHVKIDNKESGVLTLEKLSRSTEFYESRKSIVILKYNKSYELILKLMKKKRKTTNEDCSHWDSTCQLITNLNSIFMKTNECAQQQHFTREKYQMDSCNVMGQVIDMNNKCVGGIDRAGYFIPFSTSCAPFSDLPMFYTYKKPALKVLLNIIANHPWYSTYDNVAALVREGSIIAIKLGIKGEILPCKNYPYSLDSIDNLNFRRSFGIDGLELIEADSIPFKESVTHYRVRSSYPNDDRIRMNQQKELTKYAVSKTLFALQQCIQNSIVPMSAWKSIANIRNASQRQEKLFPLFMTILSNFVFEVYPQNPEYVYFADKFVDDEKRHLIPRTILKRVVFHSFHYITRVPEFGLVESHTQHEKGVIADNILDEDCVTFESIENVEQYISHIRDTDNFNNDISEGFVQIPADVQKHANSLELYTNPICNTFENNGISSFPKMPNLFFKESYLKKRIELIAPRIAHLKLHPFPKKCLLFSLIYARTIAIQGPDNKIDLYNPGAKDQVKIIIKN